MDPRLKRRKSLKIVIGLIAILLVLAPFSLAHTDVSKMDIAEISKNPNGTTVFAGDEIIDNNGNVIDYPQAANGLTLIIDAAASGWGYNWRNIFYNHRCSSSSCNRIGWG